MELSEEDLRKISIMYKQIADLIDQCEYAADRGDIDRSMDLMKQVDQLKEAARKIANPPEEKKIAVCEVSGNFMSSRYIHFFLFIYFILLTCILISIYCYFILYIRDNDDRMRAHFEGKQFVGWKKVRDKYAQLLKQHPLEPGSISSSSQQYKRDSNNRDRDRERERDRDRERRRRSRSAETRSNKRVATEETETSATSTTATTTNTTTKIDELTGKEIIANSFRSFNSSFILSFEFEIRESKFVSFLITS